MRRFFRSALSCLIIEEKSAVTSRFWSGEVIVADLNSWSSFEDIGSVASTCGRAAAGSSLGISIDAMVLCGMMVREVLAVDC